MTPVLEAVERLRADAAALANIAGEPCVGSILLTEAAALIEALAERVTELEGARDMLMRELPSLLSNKTGPAYEGNNVAVRSVINIAAICFAPAQKDQDNDTPTSL